MSSSLAVTSQKHSDSNITPLTPNSPIEHLPIDVFSIIFSHAKTLQDARAMGLTSRYLFSNIFSDAIRWNFLLERYFPDSFASSPPNIKGLALYNHFTHVEQNRKVGKCRIHTLVENASLGLTIFNDTNILIHEGQLISTTPNHAIKVWNLKSGKEVQTFIGHQDLVSHILIDQNRLISASRDHMRKIWDLKKGEEIRTLVETVGVMLMHRGQLISASILGTIEIWDSQSGRLVRRLEGHEFPVTKLLAHKNLLMSTSDDGFHLGNFKIKVWDLNSGNEVHTLSGHSAKIHHMLVDDKDRLISITETGTMKIWDLESGEEVHSFYHGPVDIIAKPIVHGKHLISGSRVSTISRAYAVKIWDLDDRQEVQNLFHLRDVTNIFIHEGKLISTDRLSIRIWDWNNVITSPYLQHDQPVDLLPDNEVEVVQVLRQDNLLISALKDGSIKTWDLNSRKIIQTLKDPQHKVRRLLAHGDRLVSVSDRDTIKILDFSFPALSSYPKQVVEDNLAILGEMAHAHSTGRYKEVEGLAETLDPNFKQLLILHAVKAGTPPTYSALVILRTQTEACVEVLLHAIHDEDQERVSHLLSQLVTIDVQNTEIYRLLWEISGEVDSENWGEYAFHNKEGCVASLSQKEEAAVAFQDHLKRRWNKF
jgi:WD40 repeat protein